MQPFHHRRSAVHLKAAHLLAASGQPAAAEAWFRAALEGVEKVMGPTHDRQGCVRADCGDVNFAGSRH